MHSLLIALACMSIGASGPEAIISRPLHFTWMVGQRDSLSVTVISDKDNDNLLRITDASAPRILYERRMEERILGSFTTRPVDGLLVTLWSSGRAFSIVVLQHKKGSIVEVLSDGAPLVPEVAFDQEGRPAILLSEDSWVLHDGQRARRPATTLVYRWDGRQFTPPERVNWNRRFSVVVRP